MKYYLYALVALMLFSSTASAQKSLATMTGQPDPSSITGGLGLTWINGQAYYLILLLRIWRLEIWRGAGH